MHQEHYENPNPGSDDEADFPLDDLTIRTFTNITQAYEGFTGWVETNGEKDQGWREIPSDESNVYEKVE